MIYSQHFDAIFVAGNISCILIHIQILSGLFNFYYDVTMTSVVYSLRPKGPMK